MSISAIWAGLLRVSQCVLEQTNEVFPICNVGGDYRRSSRGDLCSNRTAVSLDFRRTSADKNFALKRVCGFISRFMLGHRLGLSGAQRHSVFCFALRAPSGVSVPPKTSFQSAAKNALLTFLGPSQKADLRHLGAGPTRQLRST
jgi:hypothetical protein